MMHLLLIVDTAELVVLSVEFLGVDDESSTCELCTPRLEDLLELGKQIVHFALKNLDVFVEVHFDTVCRQQQV
jgi:hypothetical protein